MSGWRPLIKGYIAALRLIVGAVMSEPVDMGLDALAKYLAMDQFE